MAWNSDQMAFLLTKVEMSRSQTRCKRTFFPIPDLIIYLEQCFLTCFSWSTTSHVVILLNTTNTWDCDVTSKFTKLGAVGSLLREAITAPCSHDCSQEQSQDWAKLRPAAGQGTATASLFFLVQALLCQTQKWHLIYHRWYHRLPLVEKCWSKAGVFKPWPGGQMQPMTSLYPAHGKPLVPC